MKIVRGALFLMDSSYRFFQSFSNHDELQKEMVKRNPHKIDIGAVFNARPSDHRKITNFQPVEKELVSNFSANWDCSRVLASTIRSSEVTQNYYYYTSEEESSEPLKSVFGKKGCSLF